MKQFDGKILILMPNFGQPIPRYLIILKERMRKGTRVLVFFRCYWFVIGLVWFGLFCFVLILLPINRGIGHCQRNSEGKVVIFHFPTNVQQLDKSFDCPIEKSEKRKERKKEKKKGKKKRKEKNKKEEKMTSPVLEHQGRTKLQSQPTERYHSKNHCKGQSTGKEDDYHQQKIEKEKKEKERRKKRAQDQSERRGWELPKKSNEQEQYERGKGQRRRWEK